MFAGKGGVGKTTCACATALHDKYPDLKMVELPMFSHEIKGMDKLKEIEARLFL